MNDMFEYNAFYRDELKNKTTDLLAELDTRATQVDGENLILILHLSLILMSNLQITSMCC